MILGSHLSTSGGLHKALQQAAQYGFPALALFVRSPRQWKAPPLSDEVIETFKKVRVDSGVQVIVAHANYLNNLAGQPEVREKSLAGLKDELGRCDALGIDHLVLHPGSNPDEAQGLALIIEGLNEVIEEVDGGKIRLLLEGTAGQGNTLGHTFEQLAAMLAGVERKDRFGICLDSCHMFAAGYDIRTPETYETSLKAFEDTVGLEHLHAFHCNDSMKPFDSRKDRHEHIGLGEIGLEGFRNLVNDPRLDAVPFIMETPKGNREKDGRDWDEVNREVLQSLVKKK